MADLAKSYLTRRVDRCEDDAVGSLTLDSDADFDSLMSEDEEELIENLYDPAGAAELLSGESAAALQSLAVAHPQTLSATAEAPPEFHALFRELADDRPRDLFPERGGFFQWLTLMTWCEQKIWAAVQHYYPDVEMFVAHMMDLEHHYDPHVSPVYAWPDEQLRRMARLMDASDGKLLTFVAFDPTRDDWRAIVDRAIAAGCIGVKFYPPSGYAPFDAASNDFPDANTRDLFLHCEQEQIPVFTHCTPGGFEAVGGYGMRFGKPSLWARALERVPRLRLCFGHAGGEAGWFGRVAKGDPDFPAEVIRLCQSYPNVYAEVGYLDDVFEVEKRELFLERLRAELPAVGTKLMYGSDWHMIHRLRRHAQYYEQWRQMLAPSEWNDFRDDFFGGNAVRWLNLRGHIVRQQQTGRAVEASIVSRWERWVQEI